MYQCLVARYVWYGLAWIHHQYDRYVSWIPVVVHPRCFHCSGTSKQESHHEDKRRVDSKDEVILGQVIWA
ncbi:hypothetical protein AFLA_004507 [Aspergillus flavus NRRL3357]|nr:hypothetical protein AFLA_004507 [Aspergillus flavus NRRL3357]